MKIVTIVGARPQFVKAAPVSRLLTADSEVDEIIIHTGQHYDPGLSQVFFNELGIPAPAYNLGAGSGTQARQTAAMMIALEDLLATLKPDWVLVYGDTNSTLAGALVAAKLCLPLTHVEAGLRSFNRAMPEEINRITTDHVSSLLFAPTRSAVDLLAKEGLQGEFSGDVMYDAWLYARKNTTKTVIPHSLPERFYLATLHRPYNTDEPDQLNKLMAGMQNLRYPVVLPMHPRTAARWNGITTEKLVILPPVGYGIMQELMQRCQAVLTDSGGLQKEAYFMQKQCLTIRTETEWKETLHNHWNALAGDDPDHWQDFLDLAPDAPTQPWFGDGKAAQYIVQRLKQTGGRV